MADRGFDDYDNRTNRNTGRDARNIPIRPIRDERDPGYSRQNSYGHSNYGADTNWQPTDQENRDRGSQNPWVHPNTQPARRSYGYTGSTGAIDNNRSWGQGQDVGTYRERPTHYSHLRCRDIMTRDVTTATPDMGIVEVAKLMRDEDVGAIPVIEAGKIKGIVTDRDIVIRAIAEKDQDPINMLVRDVMSDDVYSVKPNDRVVDAIRKMGNKQVRRILVVDNNDKLRGIISMADVALEAEHDHELAEALEEVSEHKSWFSRLFSWW